MSNPEIADKGRRAKSAAQKLAHSSTKEKNSALDKIASALNKNAKAIIAANSIDLEAASKKELPKSLIDRLMLDGKRIEAMIEGLKAVKSLPDPIGEIIDSWKRPNGLKIKKVRVPLGVVGIIYEARPSVTVDSAALCLKAGSAVILRGGSDAIQTNLQLARLIAEAVVLAGLPPAAIQLIEDTSRGAAEDFMRARGYVDVLIPRGGKSLIQAVVQQATIPVIETGDGNCHAYVEKSADLKMAAEIVYNAKVSRPSVCNAIETLLVDESIAKEFLPLVKKRLDEAKVELRGDEKTRQILPGIRKAKEEDWRTEFLALILAVKVVANIDEAIFHINQYGTKHSETIVTRAKSAAAKFGGEIDSAAVYVNASTRFTDGFEFGFGAEIGISTQKLHARGPMGLKELTSYKYVIEGSGQVRTT